MEGMTLDAWLNASPLLGAGLLTPPRSRGPPDPAALGAGLLTPPPQRFGAGPASTGRSLRFAYSFHDPS